MATDYTAAKRISEINPMDLENKPVKVDEETLLAYSKVTGWNYWNAEVDSEESPDVSRTVNMGRIALRDPSSGTIYASELPSYIDDMIYGHLTVDSSTQKATFEDETYNEIPEYPRRQYYVTGELIPANLTFVDTVDHIQYRYVESVASQCSGNVQYGFTRVSMSDITPKGWLVVDGDNEGTLVYRTVRVVKPHVVFFDKCNDWCDVYGDSGKGFFVSDNEQANIVIPSRVADERDDVTRTRQTKDDLFEHLTNTAYRVCVNVYVKPKTMSADIVDLSLVVNGTVISTVGVDMSMPAGTYQKVCLMGTVNLESGDYHWDNTKSMTVRLQSEASMPVCVQCESGYIAELI